MSDLDGIIGALRAVGDAKTLSAEIAKEAEPGVTASVKTALSAGMSPSGETWAPRKDGGRAYADAASAVKGQTKGSLIYLTLSGPEVFGHFGFKGAEPRPMLPDAGGKIPAPITKAITEAADKVIRRRTRG